METTLVADPAVRAGQVEEQDAGGIPETPAVAETPNEHVVNATLRHLAGEDPHRIELVLRAAYLLAEKPIEYVEALLKQIAVRTRAQTVNELDHEKKCLNEGFDKLEGYARDHTSKMNAVLSLLDVFLNEYKGDENEELSERTLRAARVVGRELRDNLRMMEDALEELHTHGYLGSLMTIEED